MLQAKKIIKSRPELLAPAGDWDAMRAAVANGANAVYFGLDQFNARHRATNFKLDELPEVMAYLHAHNVKGFVTFNTLIFSDELPAAVEYLAAIARAGADAVIVQDLGIAKLLKRLAPTLHVHGSTQMTLTEPAGIRFVQDLGVDRVIVARELAIKDIQRITKNVDVPVEVFVHGALCVSYSGQCLTSEAIGGRSANRGQCAQACRLPYDLVVDGAKRDLGDKAYLLSPSDLAAYDIIDDLTDAGVISFKIEGRLKSAHYVAATTQTYRAAIDAMLAERDFAISPQQKLDLEQTFSRGFTHGFLGGVNHQQLVSARFPKARGTNVGTVESVSATGIVVKLANAAVGLKPGDGIVFDEGHPEQDEQGGRVFGVTSLGPNRIEIALGRGDVNLAYINAGALVWKTDDPAIKKRLEHSFSRETVVDRVPIDFALTAYVGKHLTLTAKAEGQTASAIWTEKTLEPASKHAINEATAREQLARLGDTPYELANVSLDAAGGPMVPKSVLNDLRRQCVEQLLARREASHSIAEPEALETMRADITQRHPPTPQTREHLYVLIRTLEQLETVLAHNTAMKPSMIYADFEDVRRYPEAITRCRDAGMPIALVTLRIVKPGEEGFLRQVSDCNPDALLVRCLAAVRWYRENAPHLPQIGDYSLNVANEITADIFAATGLMRMVPSYDLNWKQMAALFARFDPNMFECVVHQHMPMFHMEHCVFAHTLSKGKDFHDCGRPCEKHRVDLADRVGEHHPLIPDVGCRNTVYNGLAQTAAEYLPEMRRLGVKHFRLELLRENAAETAKILDRYINLLTGVESPLKAVHSLRVLNQLGVSPGTFAHE